jgi:hypothetical protein
MVDAANGAIRRTAILANVRSRGSRFVNESKPLSGVHDVDRRVDRARRLR